MLAVTNTTPINYLVLIDSIDLLRALYQRVLLPAPVLAELQHARAPDKVREWVCRLPEWVEVRAVDADSDPSLAYLEVGERAAIVLAGESGAEILIIDERNGRNAARERGLDITGTLGVLQTAAALGHVDLHDAIERLRATSFRMSPRLVQSPLKAESRA